jgi:hypothetical protein
LSILRSCLARKEFATIRWIDGTATSEKTERKDSWSIFLSDQHTFYFILETDDLKP